MLRSFGDANLFGEAYGSGPVRVVWLHGWARACGDFEGAARVLAERGVGSVALDLPGFGSSLPPERAGGARHYDELIRSALAEIALEPVVLVGHSFGGRVGVVVASRHPEMVRALVLTGTPLLRSTPLVTVPRMYRVVRWLYAKGLVSDERIEVARQRYGSADYRNARGLMRDVLVATVNESYESELRALRVPTSFVWGEDDLEVPLDVARRAASLVPSTPPVEVLRGVGHLVPLEAPGELVRVVEGALRQ